MDATVKSTVSWILAFCAMAAYLNAVATGAHHPAAAHTFPWSEGVAVAVCVVAALYWRTVGLRDRR